MKNRKLKALIVAVLLYLPLCARAEGEPAVVQNEPDTVWVRQYHTQRVWDVEFSPDGTQIVSTGKDGKIHILTTATGELLRTITPPEPQTNIVFALQGNHFYSCGMSSKIYYWSGESEQPERTYILNQTLTLNWPYIESMALSPDGRYLATCASEEAIVTNVETGEEISRFTASERHLQGLKIAFSPSGDSLAIVGHPGWLCIVKTADGKLCKEWKLNYVVDGLAYSKSGELAVGVITEDSKEYVLHLSRGTFSQRHRWDVEGAVNDLEFSAGGRYIVSAAQDGYIRIWDTDSGELIKQYTYIGKFGPQPQYCVAVAPDSNFIASANTKNFLWNAHWDLITGVREQSSALVPPAVIVDADLLKVSFILSVPSMVSVEIVDIQGRVRSRNSDHYSTGAHEQRLPIPTLGQGTYYCRIRAGEDSVVQPFTITR